MPSCEVNNMMNGTTVREIYIPSQDESIIERGIGQTIMETVQPHLDKIAQVDPVSGLKETYSSMISRSIRVAQNLRARGIVPGDIISMCNYNNLDYSPVMIASFFIGTYTAPMDPTSPLCDFTYLIKLVNPKILFCDEDSLSVMEQAVRDAGLEIEVVVFGDAPHGQHTSFSEFLVEQGPESEFEVYKPKSMYETCCIHFSSGTTGLPKAVCVTHYGLSYVIDIINSATPVYSKTVMIVTTPFWVSNMNSLILSIFNGDSRIMSKKFNEKTCMKYVQDYKVNVLFITPANGAKLLQDPENYCNYDVSSMTIICSGGSPTSIEQYLNYMKVFPKVMVIDGYGMTECGGVMLKLYEKTEEELRRTKIAPCGIPIPGFRYKIVDPETEEICGPNQPGELRVKCKGLFKTYYKNHQAYLDSFDSDGFFKTGDIMYYEDGYKFIYVTRIKDIFKYMGWHISPAFIEEQIMKHPNVRNTAVVGIPMVDGEGEYPTAAVVLKNPNDFDEQEMIHFVNDNLPEKYHIRGGIFPVDDIPTTSTGKMQRKKITEYIRKQIKNKI